MQADSNLDPSRTRWLYRELDAGAARRLTKELGVAPLVARILASRELTAPETVRAFYSPGLSQMHDPMQMKGMERAVKRIAQALRMKERILIFGDYDVDGITSTVILMNALRELGGDVDYYIPHRFEEGYGLNIDALEKFAAEGNPLVITVDCGITSVAEAARAKELGLDLIVTDHHEPGDELPGALAIVNPRQPGCPYPFKGLCGAGVAFKLAHALFREHHPDSGKAPESLKALLDLVTLGTVADVVPLQDENRALVNYGLTQLTESDRHGVESLKRHAGFKGGAVTADTVGFLLGPRLNAAGRTEHAFFGVELLMAENRAEADRLAQKLEQFNRERRAIEQDILDEALEMAAEYASERVIVLEQDGWHQGVLGIVASRIKERFHKPAIMIGVDNDLAKGSARSIEGFDMHAALTHCAGHLVKYGGHKMAAGLTVESVNIGAFREAINAYAHEYMDEESLRPLLWIDAQGSGEDISAQTVEQLDRLAPYGAANPKPVIAFEGMALLEPPRILKDRHLKLRLSDGHGNCISALGWGMANRAPELENLRGRIRAAGALYLNNWNGQSNVELELKDFQRE